MGLNTEKTKRLLAIHGWSGVILGLFLYVVVVSGSVAVFAHEIGQWSVGGKVAKGGVNLGVHDQIVSLSQNVDPSYLEAINVFENSAGHVVAFFHTHGLNDSGDPDDIGALIEFHPVSKEVISHREGFGSDLFGHDPLGALDEFIVALHVSLHIPDPWGLYATGILGFLMFVAAGSGLLIHKHLLKDIFVPPRYSSALLNKRDRHILAGSWALPFSFVLAFTGAFLSFALSLGFPMVAKSAFGGDQIAMFEALAGKPAIVNETPTTAANIDTILADSAKRAGSDAYAFNITHWGRADASIDVFHPNPEGELIFQKHAYSLAQGEFREEQVPIGQAPSASNTALILMRALHFGDFSGLISKFIWVSLGIALAYVNITGLDLWIQRRTNSVLWRRFEIATTITGYGVNIALACAVLGFFLSLPFGMTLFWTPAGFVLGASMSIAAGCGMQTRKSRRAALHYGLALLLIVVPLARIGTGGGFGRFGIDPIVVMMDLLCIIAALWMLASEITRRRGLAPHFAGPAVSPAE
ncbi:MAG: PepSY-associated TM helix domain-containing protein [Pseudomonadota bacterium]